MMERLIAALGKQGLTVEEIADAIWLASQMQPTAQESTPVSLDNPIPLPTVNRSPTNSSNTGLATPSNNPKVQPPPSNPKVQPPPSSPKVQPPPSNPQAQTSQVGIYAQQKGSSAVQFRVPDASSLREPLNLARAMRSLMRRVPSSTSTAVLDEAATTQRIAEEGIWIPVLKPTVEPWLEVALVVDESESMLIWRHTVVEFQRLLEHYGGFRDVRTWGLISDDSGKVKIRSGIGLAARNQRPRSPKELIEPNGRRLILIASDCIAKIWQNGAVLDALKIWAESGQVAIVQMLPQYMWEKTALGLATEVLFRTLEAGIPNQRLLVKQLSAWDDIDIDAGIKVPVVTLEPEKLSKWAQMVTGRSDIWTLGYVFEREPVDESIWESVGSTTELSAEKRLQRFRVTASPMARKLAVLLAAAPVICLPIVRIIQAQMLPESRQVHVAEVFLGGLLKPLSRIDAETNPDLVEYDFMLGVRDILLESIPALDSLDVIGKVSEFVANHLGVSLAEFAAVLRNPAQAKDEKVAEKARPFAMVTAQVLKRMGGEYTRIAEQLERQVAGDATNQIKQDIDETKGQVIAQMMGDLAIGQLTVYLSHAQTEAKAPQLDSTNLGDNPYRGLLAFRETDGDRFFGRETQIEQLWQKFCHLHEDQSTVRVLPIYGPSGSGKSSLARAGLIPALGKKPLPGRDRARLAVLVPGTHPLEALATVLARIATNDLTPVKKSQEFEEALKTKSDKGNYEGLRRIADTFPDIAISPLIILVDQFEEVYTYALSLDKTEREAFIAERDAFVENLLCAAAEPTKRVSVILTLRSDFLGDTQQHPRLNKLFSTQGFGVPIMQPKELEIAITKPAEQAGYKLDKALVTLLVEQTQGREGALPLLQFALTRIWEGLQNEVDPATTLENIGGVGGALAGEAQRLYESLSDEEQAIARSIFLALVQVSEDRGDTRRRTAVSELIASDADEARVWSIINRFAEPRVRFLVIFSDKQYGETIKMIEVAHEALIRNWKELKDWLKECREALRKKRKIEDAAEEWKHQKKSKDYLLRGRFLRDAREFVQAANEVELSSLAMEFLQASQRDRVDRRVKPWRWFED